MIEIALSLLAAPNWYYQCPAVMRSWYTWGVFCLNSAINKSCCIVWYQQTWLMPQRLRNGKNTSSRSCQVCLLQLQGTFLGFHPGICSRGESHEINLSFEQVTWITWFEMLVYVALSPPQPPTKKIPQSGNVGVSTSNSSQSEMPQCFSQRLWREIWLWPPSHDQRHPRRCFSMFVYFIYIKDAVTSLGER